MAYIAWTFWLLLIVLSAWGVRELLSGLIKPKVLNIVLLPGTLVGVAGHVLGLLVTGATVRETTLIKNDETGEPATTMDPAPRIPLVGPLIIGMLPLLACAVGIYVVARYLGPGVLRGMRTDIAGAVLPATAAGFWELLRDQITLAESFLGSVWGARFSNWRTLLFLYLAICLTIRMAPFPGTGRATLLAAIVLGITGAFCTWAFGLSRAADHLIWPVVNLTAAIALCLLFVTLLARGGLLLVQVIRGSR